MRYPLVQEIVYQDPLKLFYYFALQPGAVFLDSSRLMQECGRYSFIGIDPFYLLRSKNDFNNNPFQQLRHQLAKYPLFFHKEMPPFQGGVIGYFSYDLCHYLEKLPKTHDEMQFPGLLCGFYDLVMTFDHQQQRAWIFSSGYPLQTSFAQEQRAIQRCAWLQKIVENEIILPDVSRAVCNANDIQSNFSREEYHIAVKRVIDYILAGDIFEANISQCFKAQLPSELSPYDLYRRLRLINPAPFSSYLHFDDVTIASASPERFLRLIDKQIETRPIKGTRPRGVTFEQDQLYANELLSSEKDRAENIMIVDLLRNDLSKVSEDYSVYVPQLCGLESYATVHHLVSVVQGKLKNEYDVIDLLQATFPGGSITGAPKIRAMEIIAELESTQRGPYCGSIGYIGFNGDFDSSIAIRTYAIKNNIVTFQAGGAIVADSNPEAEYAETLTKAKALYQALTQGSL